MAILVDADSRVIVQGATGRVGRAFAERMARHYETFVGGVTPGRSGQDVGGRPVYDTVAAAVAVEGANASVVTVPAAFVSDAVYEAIDAGIKLIAIYSDLVPIHEAIEFIEYAKLREVAIIGPNAAGIVSPGLASACELNEAILQPGTIGIVSKSGSLTYEVIDALNAMGLGQSTVCCLGGDPVIGTRFVDVLSRFANDPATDGVVLLGEVGGRDEVAAAAVVQSMTKPVVAYVAGHAAPTDKAMGHAGAIAGAREDTAHYKSQVLEDAGARVVRLIDDIEDAMREAFGRN